MRSILSRRPSRVVLSALIVLAGLVLAAPSNCYRADQVVAPRGKVFDDSWRLEFSARLAAGQIAGRDFVFAYGPLYQLIHSAGLALPNRDLASILRFQFALETVLVTLAVWGLLSATGAPMSWRGPPFLLLATALASPLFVGLKPLAGLVLVALCARSLETRPSSKLRAASASILWSCTAPILGLYALDAGAVALSALLLVCAVTALGTVRLAVPSAAEMRRRAGTAFVTALGGLALFVAILSLLPGWRRYLPTSLHLAAAYPSVWGAPCREPALALLALTALASAATVVVAVRGFRAALRDPAGPPGMLLLVGGGCYSLVVLRYAIVICDDVHLIRALAPAVVVVGVLLPCVLRAGRRRALALLLLGGVLLVTLSVSIAGDARLALWRARQRLHLPFQLDWAAPTWRLEDERLEEAVDVMRRLPERVVYAWPYETLLNVLSDTQSPEFMLQAALPGDPGAAAETIRLLERHRPPIVLYRRSLPKGGVETLTRNSAVFLHLVRNYRLAAAPDESFLLLEPSRPAPRWSAHQLSRATARLDRTLRSATLAPLGDARSSDLLLLRLRSVEPPQARILKPGALMVAVHLSDGRRLRQRVLLPGDGRFHDVVIRAEPLTDPLFPSIFSRDRSCRSAVSVDRLDLVLTPLDVFSVLPRRVEVAGVSVLARDDGSFVTCAVPATSPPRLSRSTPRPGG